MKKILCIMLLSAFALLGASSAYAATDVNILPPPPPTEPSNLTVSAITDTTAQVSWPAVTSALQYTLYLNGQTVSGSNNPKVSLTGLNPHTNYTAYVVANNDGGDSPQSASIIFTTLSPIPIAPVSPTVSTSAATANISWQPLSQNFNVAKYTVYLDGQEEQTIDPKAGMQSAVIENLITGKHSISISATNDNREGPQSQPINFTISTVSVPQDFNYYNKSSDSVWLNWQSVQGAASYNVLVNGQLAGKAYSPHFTIQDLNADSVYEFSVATVMPDEEQSSNATISVTTEKIAHTLTPQTIENYIGSHATDLSIYIEILFAVIATFSITKSLKLIF